MRNEIERALPPVATVAGAADAVDEVIARLRAASGAAVLVILPDVTPMARAMLVASIAALAVELAPDTRIGAVDVASGAGPDDVVAAVRFLASAASTTGQVLVVSPSAPSPYPG